MAAMMDPTIAEISRRIGQHLSGLNLDVGVIFGGEEMPLIFIGCGHSWRELGGARNGPADEEHASREGDNPAR